MESSRSNVLRTRHKNGDPNGIARFAVRAVRVGRDVPGAPMGVRSEPQRSEDSPEANRSTFRSTRQPHDRRRQASYALLIEGAKADRRHTRIATPLFQRSPPRFRCNRVSKIFCKKLNGMVRLVIQGRFRSCVRSTEK